MNVGSVDEPTHYLEAVKHPEWQKAMKVEIELWKLTTLRLLLHCLRASLLYAANGIFKIKYKSDGSIERYKARLVTKEYNQQFGIY